MSDASAESGEARDGLHPLRTTPFWRFCRGVAKITVTVLFENKSRVSVDMPAGTLEASAWNYR